MALDMGAARLYEDISKEGIRKQKYKPLENWVNLYRVALRTVSKFDNSTSYQLSRCKRIDKRTGEWPWIWTQLDCMRI